MEAKVDKLDINKLVNVPTSLNNVEIKLDELDIGELKLFLQTSRDCDVEQKT